MRIAQVEIQNFRGIRSAVVPLPKHGVLFGENNAGKSAIAEALALLFGRDRMTYAQSDWDFYGGVLKPDSRFVVIATITEFGSTGETDASKYPRWFMGDASATPVWWHEETKMVSFEDSPPSGGELAAQVALSGRFNEDACEFEIIRFFYDGVCDPFTDEHRPIPAGNLQELGVFLLPNSRQWDRTLAFGSSSFLKVLRQSQALPGSTLSALKEELRAPKVKIEDAPEIADLLKIAEEELQAFGMLETSSRLLYRPTSLDTLSVLQSLVPHIQRSGDPTMILPLARHGSGVLALQSFLLVLAFAQHRRKAGKNFILIAEEPELHLHPSLHRRLANRIRSLSTQSLVTTHSPTVAGSYQPTQSVYIKNDSGTVHARLLREKPIAAIGKDSVEKLYLQHREAFYEALMGGSIVIPEGQFDYEWLQLWQRVAGSADSVAEQFRLTPLTIVPTSDSAIVATVNEIVQFRRDILRPVDGDAAGEAYAKEIKAAGNAQQIATLGKEAGIELLSD